MLANTHPEFWSYSGASLMKIDVHKVEDFPYPVERLWEALTDPVALARWLMPNDFEPRVGRSFRRRGEPMPGWRGWTDCVVLELEPPHRMVWSWLSTDDGPATRVEFHLQSIDGGSSLTFTHTGDTDPIMLELLEQGWNAKLQDLRTRFGGITDQ